jgi:molybdopterin synthase catalytic subunit
MATPLVWFAMHEGPLQGDTLRARVAGDDAGCVVEFRGTVRGTARGLQVMHLEYQAYPAMVEAELQRIASEVAAQHEILRIAIEHSVGLVAVGACSVHLAIAAAHRASAFAAATALMDELKVRVPIWKKEVDSQGGVWLGRGS